MKKIFYKQFAVNSVSVTREVKGIDRTVHLNTKTKKISFRKSEKPVLEMLFGKLKHKFRDLYQEPLSINVSALFPAVCKVHTSLRKLKSTIRQKI